MAVNSQADELFYGGAAGGGKTDLLLGLAGTQHHRSIIFRRVFPSMRGIIDRSREIYNARSTAHAKDSYNESLHIWRLTDGKMIEFGSLQYEKNVEDYRGRPHDLYCWDEITEFMEFQYQFVNGWNRSTRKGQRKRIVATGNPPTHADGLWVIKYWGPWLDTKHPHPARPGELRYFAVIAGESIECDGKEPITHNGEIIYPRSRTFIPAKLSDNAYLSETGYITVLQGLPEPLRTQMLYGDFSVGISDDERQVIPTEWVLLAQERWKARTKPERPMTTMGVDVARGGKDKTVISCRYGNWFAPLLKYPGTSTPDGPAAAAKVISALGEELERLPNINVDVIGYGSSAFDSLIGQGFKEAVPVNVAVGSSASDKTGRLGFVNLKAEITWKFREALDPDHGEDLALPDDPELLADLTAPRWELKSNGIQIEGKPELKKRIGRSPDCADAVILAHYQSKAQSIMDHYMNQFAEMKKAKEGK